MAPRFTPKNRTAATGQTDQVILPFIIKSIPRKKAAIISITAMPYHHFFRPFTTGSSFVALMI